MEIHNRILIADNSLELGTELSQKLYKRGFSVALCPKDSASVHEAVRTDRKDFIVLDDTMSGASAWQTAEEICKSAYSPVFIIITPVERLEYDLLTQQRRNVRVLQMPFDSELLADSIETMPIDGKSFRENYHELEMHIAFILQSECIPASVDGFRYLMSAAALCYLNESLLDNVTKELYPIIAELNSKSSHSIERSIRHAIKAAWEHRSPPMPTNTEMLTRVLSGIE